MLQHFGTKNAIKAFVLYRNSRNITDYISFYRIPCIVNKPIVPRISLRLTDILTYLLRNPSLPVPERVQITHPAVMKLTHHINESFDKPLTLEDAAKSIGMDRTYLSKLFHSNTGFTFKSYLSIIRIKHAKELLRESGKSVTEIAHSCGFEDSNYFSTVFKKSENMTPLEYRSALMAENL